jgi:ubiquinone/menaquinone biosynthesis C-methylase UbiE
MKDYKAIWNNLSHDSDEAAFYVCCVQDEAEISSNGKIAAQYLVETLQIQPTDRVLEIGCGIARVGKELAPACGEWHGADISGNMIQYAGARTTSLSNVFLHELPDSSLRIFPDGYFDRVYCVVVFMHLDKLDVFRYICEAHRVLKAGGIAYFDTYNLLSTNGWHEFKGLLEAYPLSEQRPSHMSQFSTPQEIRKFMHEAGFERIHIIDDDPTLVAAIGHRGDV